MPPSSSMTRMLPAAEPDEKTEPDEERFKD
jgi:hypothetical protein